ncbi:hypothetical protein [Dellaglioa algida]|uniref:hypothetical protein n=1 Tax=Dellaglioa algida TaxID=105612 RepID=UPI000BC60BCF|nr:hypothetical protein [Dellaglioa algida]MDK1718109.1 hypothetical protein [Dellaglioa algida]MDK1729122.1 hypothetical protein [Dellaglioa algida]MDK1741556.1 hypothetical protein [Dellaglioa algida]SOB49691.1 membrane hypothetical protein [Dellaglioa algida]
MQYLGPFIILVWFIMTTMIYMSTKTKRRKFSYKSLFFGSLAWEKNSRNWLLILGLFLLVSLNPITDTFVFLILLGCYIIVLAGTGLLLHRGNHHQHIQALFFSIFLIGLACYPLLSNLR